MNEKELLAFKNKTIETFLVLKQEKSKTEYEEYVEYVHGYETCDDFPFLTPNYKHAKHTRLVCDALQRIEEGKLKRLMIFMPPGHGKSMSTTETFPSFFIGKDPKRRVIQASYGDDLATDFGGRNLDKVNKFGKALFNIEVNKTQTAKSYWGVKGKRGHMISCGIKSGITGKRADLLLIDDPVKNDEEASSQTIRDKSWNEYEKTLNSRLLPDSAVILIMTRWNIGDIAGRILKQIADGIELYEWEVINLPCEAEEGDLLGREVGEPLWPEYGFNTEWIRKEKRKASKSTWASLYQQRPFIEGGNKIDIAKFKFYSKLPVFEQTLQSWDMAFKDKKDSDFVVGQVWGQVENKLYLIDQVRGRMNFENTAKAFINLTNKYPSAGIKLIEDKANGPAIISSLRYKIGGITPINPRGSKVARAEAITPLINAGLVYLPNSDIAPWIISFVNECEVFPEGDNDDQVDSMTQAISRFLYLLENEITEEELE